MKTMCFIVLSVAMLCGCRPQRPSIPPPASSSTQEAAFPANVPLSTRSFGPSAPLPTWKNPVIVVWTNGASLQGGGLLQSGQISNALARLPKSSWPDGRILLIATPRAAPSVDLAPIRKKEKEVMAELDLLGVKYCIAETR